MSIYTEQIAKATKCDPSDAPRIEEIMRSHILGRTMNAVPLKAFNAAARKAKGFMDFERTPEGISLAAQIEDEMLNPR